IGEIGKARAARVCPRAPAVGEVAVVALLRAFVAGSVDLAAVEARALLGIAQKAVGGRDFLELLLGFLVAGVEVGVKLLGKRPISLLDLVRRGVFLHSQSFVRIGRQGRLLRAT